MDRSESRRRRGVSLIELLVVVGVVGLLIGLLLPAVQGAREAARRVHCAANLRQLGIALASYSDASQVLPPGRVLMYDPRYAGPDPPCTSLRVDKGPLVRLLPYLEQGALFDAINQDTSIFALENTTAFTARVGVLSCPSDPAARAPRRLLAGELEPMAPDPPGATWRMAPTSYAAAFGSLDVLAQPSAYPRCAVPAPVLRQSDGPFSDVVPIRPADIADGLSATAFLAEKAVTTFDRAGVATGGDPSKHGWWLSGNLDDALYSAMYPPNAFRTLSAYGDAARVRSASSLHPGGLHVLMGDGSAHFLKETVQSWPMDPITGQPAGARKDAGGWWDHLPPAGVWQALHTRAGGEIIDAGLP